MECSYCGGENVVYEGIDDGLGPYGDCVGDLYYCEDCDLIFEGHVIPYGELGDDDEAEDWQIVVTVVDFEDGQIVNRDRS